MLSGVDVMRWSMTSWNWDGQREILVCSPSSARRSFMQETSFVSPMDRVDSILSWRERLWQRVLCLSHRGSNMRIGCVRSWSSDSTPYPDPDICAAL